MPIRTTRRGSEKSVRIASPGQGGVDLFTDPSVMNEDRLSLGQNIDLSNGDLRRRPGCRTVYDFSATNGSVTFAADTKYMKITAATQLLIAKGGFAVRISFTAVRPSGGNTAHILATRVNGKAYGPLSFTLSDAGVLTASWRLESDESAITVTSSALDAGVDVHAWLIFDPVEAETYLYIDGVLVDTETAGMTASDQPMQDGPDWYIGVEYNPATAGVTANTHFDGKVDGFAVYSLAGTRPGDAGDGDQSLIGALTRFGAFQQTPNPAGPMCLAAYDFDEGSGTSAKDRSRFENHGTYTGGPSFTAAVCGRTRVGQYVGVLENPDGSLFNVVIAGGTLYYERVKGATS